MKNMKEGVVDHGCSHSNPFLELFIFVTRNFLFVVFKVKKICVILRVWVNLQVNASFISKANSNDEFSFALIIKLTAVPSTINMR